MAQTFASIISRHIIFFYSCILNPMKRNTIHAIGFFSCSLVAVYATCQTQASISFEVLVAVVAVARGIKRYLLFIYII